MDIWGHDYPLGNLCICNRKCRGSFKRGAKRMSERGPVFTGADGVNVPMGRLFKDSRAFRVDGGHRQNPLPVYAAALPLAKKDSKALTAISMNITANLLGLGNAATPLGITAMKALKEETPGPQSDTASHSMILFVLLNTASIQLLPTTVATLRLQNGSAVPMDILPPVLLTSFLSLLVALFGALCCKQTLRAKQHFTIREV